MARSKTFAALAVASLATACGRAPEPVQSRGPAPVATNPAPAPAPKPVEAFEPSFGGKPLHEWTAWIEVDSYADSPSDETVAALRAMGAPAIAVIAKRVDVAPLPDAVRGHVLEALAAFGPAARDTVIGLTRHADPQVRAEAACWLHHCTAPGGEDVVDALAALLDDREIGYAAVYGLAQIENPCPRVLDLLVGALDHPNAESRVVAARALAGKGRVDDAKLIDRFVAVLLDPKGGDGRESSARTAAAQALATMDGDVLLPAMPVLVAALEDKNDDVGRAVAKALARIGPRAASAAPRVARLHCRLIDSERPEIVDALRKLGATDVADRLESADVATLYAEWLRDENRVVRFSAADRLDELGPSAASAIPALLAALDVPGEDTKVRQSVTYALGEVGPGDARVRTALIALLLDGDSYIASAAAAGLERGFATDVRVRDALLAALTSPRCKVRGEVARALVPFGADVAQALVDALSLAGPDDSWDSVGNAVRKLGAPAVPALVAAFASERAEVRERSLAVLARIEPLPPELPGVARAALDDSDEKVRLTAADALGRSGDAGKPGATRLREALADKSPSIRAHAAAALWRVTKSPRDCVDPLVDALGDEDFGSRAAAALAEMGAAAAPAAARIAKLLDAPDVAPSRRDAMIDVLAGIGPAARPAVPGLIRSLHGHSWCSEQTYVPTAAIAVLGEIGPDAKSALPALRALRKESPSLAADIDAAVAKIEAKR